MENLENQCVCVIVLASSGKFLCECFCVCSVQRVLSVWGKSLFPGRKLGRPHPPTTLSSGWLTLLPGYRPVGVHTSWLPVFSLKLTFPHCFSLTCALARPPPFKKTWTPSPEKGSEGRKKRGSSTKEKLREGERKSGPQFLWRLALANPKPTKNEIGGEREEGMERRQEGVEGLMKKAVDEGNL